MSIDFTPEQIQIRDAVEKLCAGFGDEYWLARDNDKQFPEDFCQAIADAGFMGIAMPEEYGGSGLGITEASILMQEISRSGAGNGGVSSVSLGIFGLNPVVRYGTDEQKAQFLPRILATDDYWCQGYSEPGSGSDLASLKTRAVADGDDYIINGHKRFITGASNADFAQIVTSTDREKGSRGGLTVFLVDMDAPGITKLRQQDMMIADRPWEILFENVRVPASQRVGEEGDGMRAAQSWLTEGRLRHGARGVGVITRCLELAATYANQRSTFGAKLSSRQTVQNMLVDMFQNRHQLQLMVYNASWRADQGEDVRKESYMCKYFGDEMSFQAADRCMQIHGGMGLTKDLPIEQFFRDQRSMVITEGPTEILKMALARQILRDYGE